MLSYALLSLNAVPLLAAASEGGPFADTDSIDLKFGADVATLPNLQTTPEYLATEERILERLDQTVPPDQEMRILLLGPGSSTTDPLYARRFLDGWQARRGRPASLDIFDFDSHRLIKPYLAGIDWGDHVVRRFLGRLGDIRNAEPSQAHLMITLHPNYIFQQIEELALRHLVSGGLLLLQEDYSADTADQYSHTLTLLQRYLDTNFTHLQPLYPGPLMDTAFSRLFSIIHTFVLERKT